MIRQMKELKENNDNDDFFNNKVFLVAVAALEKAIIKNDAKSTEDCYPSFSLELTLIPIEGGHQSPQEIFDEYVHYFIYLFYFFILCIIFFLSCLFANFINYKQ